MIPKFKAWHKAEKVMCDVSIINFDSGAFLVGVKKGEDQIGDKYFVEAPTDGRFCNFDEFELLQYTGLKDKNGKEIYEGDILKVPEDWEEYGFMSGEERQIYFNTGGFRLKPKKGIHAGHWLEGGSEFEIIGNIHSTPELLT